MACPSWCSTHCWALVVLLFALTFFLGAFVSPWYVTQQKIDAIDLTVDTLYYWKGAEQYTDQHGDTSHETVEWGDIPGGEDAQRFYDAANAMAILGFVFTLVLIGMIIFGMINSKRQNEPFPLMCAGKVKFIILGMTVFILLFSLLSWTVFIGFNRQLKCPSNQDDPCSTFAGSKSYPNKQSWVWMPTYGWIFAAITTPFVIAALVLAVFIPRGDRDQADGLTLNDDNDRRPIVN